MMAVAPETTVPLATVLLGIGSLFVGMMSVIVPTMIMIFKGFREIGKLEGVFNTTVNELRKAVDELRLSLKEVAKISDHERRLSQAENTLQTLTGRIHSTDKMAAVTKTEVEHFKEEKRREQSYPHLPPAIPRSE